MTSTHTHSGPAPRLRGRLVTALADNWWLFMLRGVAAMVLGVLAFMWPGWTMLALVFVWAAYALVDGVLAVVAALSGKGSHSARWWLLAAGVVGIAAGVCVFARPGLAALVLLAFVAGWSLIVGVMQLIGAISLRKEIDNEWMLALSGLANVIFGVLLMFQPVAGAVALAWMIGVFAIIVGLFYFSFGLRLRKHRT
jgi:uncharacterized membrane protein HdeD (DUF308 family)